MGWPASTVVASRYEPKLQQVVLDTAVRWARDTDQAALRQAAEHGDADLAARAMRVERWAPMLKQGVRAIMIAAFQDGGKLGMSQLAERRGVDGVFEKRTAIQMIFDAVNEYSVAWAEAHAAELVVAPEATQLAIRELIVQSQRDKITVDILAKMLRGVIGLDPRRMAALERFTAALVEQAAPRIEARTVKYAGALLKQRAWTIARTETIAALAGGQQAAWDASIEQGLIRKTAMQKTWITTDDERLCVPARTKVLTITGWRAVSKITVGDHVLTHLDRFRPVTATHSKRYDGQTVKLTCPNSVKVTATYGHKVLTGRGWVPIEDVSLDDMVAVAAQPCVECGTHVPVGPYRISSGRCAPCARHHANTVGWRDLARHDRLVAFNRARERSKGEREKAAENGRRMSPEARARIADAIRRRTPYIRTNEIRAAQSRALRASQKMKASADNRRGQPNVAVSEWYASLTAAEKQAKLAKMMAGNSRSARGSSLERTLREWLDAQRLAYVQQWPFDYQDGDRVRRGFADFYLPGPNMVVECDGYFHFRHEETRRRDRLRDESLAARGVETLRFDAPTIRTSFDSVASAIRGRCCIAWVRPLKIKHSEIRRQPVYDIQVSEDESFIAGGLVLHNCTICEALDGEAVDIDDEFTGGHMGPPAHPQCRCATGLVNRRKEA